MVQGKLVLNVDKCKEMVIDFQAALRLHWSGLFGAGTSGLCKGLGPNPLGEPYVELPRRKDHHKGKQVDVFYYLTKTSQHSRG